MTAAHDFAAPNEAYAAAMELSRVAGQLLLATKGHVSPAIAKRIPSLKRQAIKAARAIK